jgi:putative restriction endonuclease
MEVLLTKYITAFQKLRVDRSHGSAAPHKPILLLSILQAVKAGAIADNKIFITPELIASFKANWANLVTTNHSCKLALPFFHLRSEGFWTLIARQGNDSQLLLASSISSINQLDSLVEYALLDEALFDLMTVEHNNLLLQQALMLAYFPGQHENLTATVLEYQSLLVSVAQKILYEPASAYKKEIESLLAQNNEEEIFFRGSLFKKEIPRMYQYACCISGLRVSSMLGLSMIDACHIRPFSESYDDTISNGISLCPNLHRAFDRGLISLDNEYRVLVSSAFTENETPYGIKQFEGKTIELPRNQEHWPLVGNLEWHRERVFKL